MLSGEDGDLFSALQVPQPQLSVIRGRDGPAPSGVTATALTPSVWPSSVRILWPLSKSQSRSVRSLEPETAWRPSGVTATARPSPYGLRGCGWFGRSPGPTPAAFRHLDAETARRPSGVTATAPDRSSVWPSSVRMFGRFSKSQPQRPVIGSRDGRRPSGVTATA